MRRTMLGLAMAAALGLAPVGAIANDDQIAQSIVAKLQAQKNAGAFKNFQLGLKVDGGVVVMEGHVPTPEQQSLALDIARRVKGVKMVVNDIQIEPTKAKPAAARKDDQLTESSAELAQPVASSRRATSLAPSAPIEAEEAAGTGLEKAASHSYEAPASIEQEVVPTEAPAPAKVSAVRKTSVAPFAARPASNQTPVAMAPSRTLTPAGVIPASAQQQMPQQQASAPIPSYVPGTGMGVAPAQYDHPQMPNYAWPSYASHPNYAAVTYPRQYSPSAWPYIGPFYPYPQVPLGWRKVTLEWDDGWWFLDFKNRHHR